MKGPWSPVPGPWSAAARDARGGFALLITVTLLAFIVVLLVGLAAFTRIETAAAGNTQRQAQARENALLGLNLALGQLQKHAGPDQRVTATAEAFGGTSGTLRYTGVWDATAGGTTPLTWLVSGNELNGSEGKPAPLAITPASAMSPTNSVALVGANTSRTANDILVRLQDIKTTGVPGGSSTAATTIGRYAWWVGDQGVKAPVAVPDNTSAITYAPFDSAELRSRLRQQLPLGAGAADTSGNPVFDSRDGNNATLVANDKVIAASQLPFLKSPPPSTSAIGLTRVQTNFHAWSPNNFAVLANTKSGGLKQDLSIDPSLLGADVQSWLNFPAYMESPANSATSAFPPTQPIGADSPRRRYIMRASAPSIAPVLSYFFLSFNVRTQNQTRTVAPLEVRARWILSLWNPFSSALVPEDLRIEISGLPEVRVDDETASVPGAAAFSLHSAFGAPLNISLPWASASSAGAAGDDQRSWLPGRVYTWLSRENTSFTVPSGGFDSIFYPPNRNLDNQSGSGVIRAAPTAATIDGDHTCHIDGDATSLTATLYVVRPSGDVRLGTFISMPFDRLHSGSQPLYQNGYQFAYLFRLAETTENPDWLKTAGVDFHSGDAPASAYVSGPNGPDPAQYADRTTFVVSPDRLLDRATGSRSYDEDVPLFEFPRAPVLSLGALQHVALAGRRPFALGNSWIGDTTLNGVRGDQVFDRFFFSGLGESIVPAPVNGSLLLPNPLLKVLRDPTSGAAAAAADLRGAVDARSSKFLLQGGAFNLNSTKAEAWAAVLRSVRFPAPQSFGYLDADFATGTGDDSSIQSVQSGDAQFFRFSQSAQETYKADAGYAASTVAPPTAPDVASAANTHLFRRGMRTLTSAQVGALAARIAGLVSANGPFRSLEDFLKANAAFNGQSLLERAIADANLNVDSAGNAIEFSSQFLTQADVMTALAPVLFARSDTFIIRAYGEAVNPATQATEGRAWCEATVQRLPEYFDKTADAPEVAPAALTSALNQALGRRFKIVSFRWLTRSDI